MSNKYRIKFDWWNGGPVHVSDKILEAPTPVSALNQFHQWMQWGRQLDKSGEVIRPNLCWGDYKITNMAQMYHDAALHKNPSAQPMIYSDIDLPSTPNPNLNKVINVYEETTEFPFVKEIDSKREVEFERAHGKV